MRAHHAILAATLVLSITVQSRADLAPPADFVETCTMDKQASAGQECNSCRAYYGNHEHCRESLAAFGFSQKCRTRGASSWSEIWCRAASPTAVKVPAKILEQLSDAQGKPGPMPAGLVAPAPSGSAAPAASTAPVDSAVPPAVASAVPNARPAASSPQPAASSKPASPPPPAKKSSCTLGSHETGNASSCLAFAGLAVALLRRRPR